MRSGMALRGIGDLQVDFVFRFVFVFCFLDALLDGFGGVEVQFVVRFVFVLWFSRCALRQPFGALRTFRSTLFFVPFSFYVFWMRFWMALEVLRSSSCFVSFLICCFPDAL